MRWLFWLFLPALAFGSATSYTIASPFVATGATATGALGGQVLAVGGTFDGVSYITITLSDGAGHSANSGPIFPVSGSASARWALTVPNATGTYSLTGVATGGSIASNPSAQSVAIGAVLSLGTNQSNYLAMQCGTFFHFNMSTFTGGQWASPNLAVDTFAPTNSAVAFSEFTAATTAAGCKYQTLTTKHHDGFKLWYSAQNVSTNPVYGVQSTSWYAANGSPDLVLQFVNAAHAAGLKAVLYFSIADRTYEVQTNTTAATDAADYVTMIEAELTELLTYYGAIQAIWTDGWGWTGSPGVPGAAPAVGGHSAITVAPISNLIHALQPNCMLLENDHLSPGSGDMTIIEAPLIATAPGSNNTYPTETASASRFDEAWFYDSSLAWDASTLFSPRQLAVYRALNNARLANYANNLSVDESGSISAEQQALMTGYASENAYANVTDLALGATATASTSYGASYLPALLVDGVLGVPAGDGAAGYIFSSASNDENPWAQADLGSNQSIGRVEIINRTDGTLGFGTSGRFRDLTVSICTSAAGSGCASPVYTSATLNPLNVAYASNNYADGPGQITVSFPNVSGRYVRVTRAGTDTSDNGDVLAFGEMLAFTAIASNPVTVSGAPVLSGTFTIQ